MSYRPLSLKPLMLTLLLTPLPALTPSAQAADYFQQAREYHQQGNDKAAVIQLKNLLQSSPDHGQGRLLLGEIYLHRGQFTEAEKELRRARKLGVDAATVAPALVQTLLGLERYSDALNLVLRDWDADGPAPARRWALLGYAHLGQKQLEEAENAFYQSLERQPNDLAQLGLAQVAQAYGRTDEALTHLQPIQPEAAEGIKAAILRGDLLRIQGKLSEAISSYDQVLDREAGLLGARLGRAQALLELKQFPQAKSDLDYLLKALPNSPQVRVLAAVSALSERHYKEANTHAQMALQVQPNQPQAQLLAATAYYHQGQFDDAKALLEQLLKAYPNHLGANRLQAATLLRLKQPQQALKQLQPLLAKGAQDPILQALAGNAYLQSGDFENGEQLLTQAMEQLPTEGSLVNQLALSRALAGRGEDALQLLDASAAVASVESDTIRVVALMRNGERNAAIQLLQQRIAAQPQVIQYRLMLALLHQQAQQPEVAQAVYREAVAIAPNHPAPRIGLARIALAQQQLEPARRQFQQVLATQPNHLGALLGMAAISEFEHNKTATLEWLKQARSQHPGNPAAAKALVGYYLRAEQSERAIAESNNFYLQQSEGVEAGLLYAEVLQVTQQPEQALVVLRALQQRHPEHTQVGLTLANALKERGLFDAALKIVEPLEVQAGPISAPGLLKTELLILLGDNSAADKLLSRQWQQQPLPLLARLRVALAIQQQQWSVAKEFAAKVYPAQRDPKLMQMKIRIALQEGAAAAETMLLDHLQQFPEDGYALQQAAGLAHQRSDLNVASSRYQRLTELQPDNPIPWNNLAWIFLQQQDPRSLSYAREALKRAPNSGAIRDTLGWILLQQGQPAEALQQLQQAAASTPNNVEIQLHYAQALIQNGQTQQARDLLTPLAKQPSALQAEANNLLNQLN